MRSAFVRAVLARPTAAFAIPRTAAFLPSLRFSSTESTPPTPTPSTAQTSQTKPYYLEKTDAGWFPIYKTTKAAGSSKFTLIKKIHGDRKALADDIAAQLAVPRDEVTINPVTGHIRVKGDHKAAIKLYLNTVFGLPTDSKDTMEKKQAETTA